jgi:hypothetical protein
MNLAFNVVEIQEISFSASYEHSRQQKTLTLQNPLKKKITVAVMRQERSLAPDEAVLCIRRIMNMCVCVCVCHVYVQFISRDLLWLQ